MNTTSRDRLIKLVFGGIMIAMSTVLSFTRIFRMPYSGSITLCSMLPIIVYAYIYGAKWGCFMGFTNGVIHLIVDMDAVKGLSAVAFFGAILFDFLVANLLLGFSGTFRNKIKNDLLAFSAGSVLAMMLKYFSHIISGFLFFGDYADWFFSQEGFTFGAWVLENISGRMLAFIYSALYNAMYMIPEMIITTIAGTLLIKFAGKQFLYKLAKS